MLLERMDKIGGEKGNEDLYAVLGLNKECSDSELRNAYKKLALKWHPDRWSASGNSTSEEEAKNKFQAIQQAYSVLSDANKRFLYDIGMYDSDDDENGMGEFLNEMATMMSQIKPNENGEESVEELQGLLKEMFEDDDDIVSASESAASSFDIASSTSSSSSSTYVNATSTAFNKRSSSHINIGKPHQSFHFDSTFHTFCLGMEKLQYMKGKEGGGGSRRHSRQCKKQKI